MKRILYLCSAALLLAGAIGCKADKPSAASTESDKTPNYSRAMIVPEEIRNADGLLLYRVSRITSISGSVGCTSVHEIEFFAADGQTRLKKQNYLLGGPTMCRICQVWYYNADGSIKETRHLDLNSRKVKKIEYHNANGDVIKTETPAESDNLVEEVPPGIFPSGAD